MDAVPFVSGVLLLVEVAISTTTTLAVLVQHHVVNAYVDCFAASVTGVWVSSTTTPISSRQPVTISSFTVGRFTEKVNVDGPRQFGLSFW